MSSIRPLASRLILFSGLFLGAFGTLMVRAQVAHPALAQVPDPGPHVLWTGKRARITRLVEGQLKVEEKMGAAELALPGLAPKPLHLTSEALSPEPDEFPDPGRILAISDVHGDFDRLRTLLVAQGVVDAGLGWRYGKGHVVIVGDTLDRGGQVTECLWFLRALQVQARAVGGRVHVLLGNHEHMVLKGDWRYLHPRYRLNLPGLPTLAEQFSEASEIGRWIRLRPIFLRLGAFVFVHGGPGPDFRETGLDLRRANDLARKALLTGDREGVPPLLFGGTGPLWYRGLVPGATRQDIGSEELDALLKQFGARCFVVGHTSLPRITAFLGDRVYAIDAGIQEGRAGEAWIWDQGQVWRGLPDGTRVLLSGPVPPAGR